MSLLATLCACGLDMQLRSTEYGDIATCKHCDSGCRVKRDDCRLCDETLRRIKEGK